MSIWRSVKGLFGQTIHYKDGKKVGESWDGFLPGSKIHYNADGGYAGRSDPGFFADLVHRDALGSKIGSTYTDDFGMSHHYGEHGKAGVSYDGFVGTKSVFDDDFSIFDESDNGSSAFDSFDDSSW